jgi:hypothetical protein
MKCPNIEPIIINIIFFGFLKSQDVIGETRVAPEAKYTNVNPTVFLDIPRFCFLYSYEVYI